MQTHRIVLVTEGVVHPTLRAQRALRDALQDVTPGGFDVRWIRSLEEVPLNLGAKLVVLYFHRASGDSDFLAMMRGYAKTGGAILAVHGTLASFKGNPDVKRLFGGEFTRHGSVTRLKVDWKGPSGAENPVGTVRDEPYEVNLAEDVHVCGWWRHLPHDHAAAMSATPQITNPCAWTRTEGAGRIASLTLGHRAEGWRRPFVREILLSLVSYCLGKYTV